MTIYLKIENGQVQSFTETCPVDIHDSSWKCPWDLKSFEEVELYAEQLTELTNDQWVPVDRGDSCSPRYSVTRVPKVGDTVSYSFNGDTYPDGEVVKVTKTFQVTTSTGHTYRRHRQTASWKRQGWYLVGGHHYEQNPHF